MIKQILLSTIVTSFLEMHANANLLNPQQMASNISAQLNNLEQQLANNLSSIEQLMDENITQTSHVGKLLKINTRKSVQLGNGITLSAGDGGNYGRIPSVDPVICPAG